MKTIQKDWQSLQKINIETYEKKIRIKKEYGKNRFHNMSEENKAKLKVLTIDKFAIK